MWELKSGIVKMRTKTGIMGLDDLMHGGIPKNKVVLISGQTGAGKTIFGMQYLMKGIEYGEPGVYVSLEEYPSELYKDFSIFEWDLNGMEGQNRLRILRPNPSDFGKMGLDLSKLIDDICSAIDDVGAKRVVIDSVSILGLGYENISKFRSHLLEFGNLLHGLGCTTLLLSEAQEERHIISKYGVEEFVAQGIIHLYYLERNFQRYRGIEVRKMRGTSHSNKIHSMDITKKGIQVYSEVPMFE